MTDAEDLDIIVRVATGGRRVRRYVGKLPHGHNMPFGARPIEQVVAVLVSVIGAGMLALTFQWPVLSALGAGTVVGFGLALALKAIPYDEAVPPVNALMRIGLLIISSRPIVLTGDDAEDIANDELAHPFIASNEDFPLAAQEATQ
ncbi:hypothetical protein [Mycobacteroides abscessus]|uniref:hypothetical protein n=1 Tax=Mycobacteroides abscessus TaxID=36809 RepID=UPI0009A595C4|nr:hypothetical protein [Mycobacteroides abscessus]SLH38889.1 Uncharacterised protein [Mycobacteroides abscessus subsp. massiliense]